MDRVVPFIYKKNISLKLIYDGLDILCVTVLDWYNYNKDTAGYPTFMPSGYLFSRRYKYVEDNNASVQVTFNSVFLSHLL